MSNKIVFKKLQGTSHIWHKDTGLIIRSPSDKIVIGRYIDDEITPLDEEGIELCNKMKFKYEIPEEVEETEELDDTEETEEVDDTEETEEVNETEEVSEETEEVNDSEEVVKDQEKSENAKVQTQVEKNIDKFDIVIGNPPHNEDLKSTGVEPSLKVVPLTNLTLEFTQNLNKYFESLNLDFSNKISVLETKLVEKSRESDNIKEKFNDMSDKYNKLEAKFNGIKQLFSV